MQARQFNFWGPQLGQSVAGLICRQSPYGAGRCNGYSDERNYLLNQWIGCWSGSTCAGTARQGNFSLANRAILTICAGRVRG